MSEYIVPILILILFGYCVLKGIPIFDAFCEGASQAAGLVVSIFPFLVGVFFMVELAEVSGLVEFLEWVLSPIFGFVGVPEGVIKLVIFRPFSGSGSLAILQEIFEEYGVDSYEGKVASCVCGAGETVFYLSAVYFATAGIKNTGGGVAIALFSTFIGVIICSILCRFM